jgi:hypothetical protein
MQDLRIALSDALVTSVEALQDEWDPHDVPSPSGIAGCRLRQWFDGKRIPRSNRIPAASIKKMQAGKEIEGFWRTAYERLGFEVLGDLPRVPIGAHMTGEGDGILSATQDGKPFDVKLDGVTVPGGTRFLLELKDLGVWTYLNFYQKGAEEGLPDYWAQVQCYMEGYNLDACILHAGQADASAVTYIWNQRKVKNDWPDKPPPFILEIIPRIPQEFARWSGVAQEIKYYIEQVDQLPAALRDFDPHTTRYPCQWCGWVNLCKRGVVEEEVGISDDEIDQATRAGEKAA